MKVHILTSVLALMILSTTACKKNDSSETPQKEDYTVLTGDIDANTTLSADKKYLLKGFVYVTKGATLHIEPGTIIKGDKASKGSLIITRGAKIDAQGTASKPIVFTSSADKGARREGDWGGVILLGKAPINAKGGEAKIEGGLTPTAGSSEKDYIWYGGTDASDNSGAMKYCRIEFAGIAFSPDNEINGLTIAGVGNKTTFSYIQVYRSGDDAFEWFGGTANADHLVSTYTWDDDFDTDFGFSGKVQFGVAQRAKTIADQSGANAFESDNDANGSTNSPQTSAQFSNFTIVGPISSKNTSSDPVKGINANFQHGAQIRRNSSISIVNSLIIGFPIGLYIDDSKGSPTSGNASTNALLFRNNILAGNVAATRFATAWQSNGTAWFTTNNNTILDSAQHAQLQDPYKFAAAIASPEGRPNYLLKTNASAATGSDFSGLSGFVQVPYRGAFDGTNDWTLGWTNFDAENTDY